jgi:vacuolar protein-sorting-associated protein 4
MTLEAELERTIIMEILLPLQFPHLFTGAQAAERGVLLYGPPGCGKTMLVGCTQLLFRPLIIFGMQIKAVASAGCAVVFNANIADLSSKWHNEGPKLIRALFTVARDKARSGTPVIILLGTAQP